MAKTLIDIAGNKYGKLLVVKPIPYKYGEGSKRRWECRCDCGAVITTQQHSLRRGKIKSCGCSRQDKTNCLE